MIKKNIDKLLIILGIFIGMVINLNSYAILDIEITQGVDTAVPIAIYPFTIKSTNPDNVTNNQIDYSLINSVIGKDLYRSGLFIPKEQNKLSQKSHEFKLTDLPIEELQADGIEYIIRGSIDIHPYGRYSVNVELISLYQLIDAQNLYSEHEIGQQNSNKNKISSTLDNSKLHSDELKKAVLLSKTYDVEDKQLRNLAHHLSDVIYERLTGYKGIFSTKIAYVNVIWNKGDNREYILEVADSDGFNPQKLLVSSEPIMSPSWHPNGREIAYVSFLGNRSKVNVIDLSTGNTRTITSFKGINGAPAWSPDGTKMALVLSNENVPKIYLLDLYNKKLRQITYGSAIDTEPRWAPDGSSIIFTSNRGGGPQIYKYSFNNSKITRLTFEGNYNARASFTPDGNKLVMIHRKDDDKGFKIAVQDLTTYNIDVLTESNMDESPSVSSNGQQIIYATKEHDKGILAEVSIDGRVKIKRPARVGDVQEPAWSPYFS